jgi:hypothetical protein
LIAIDTNLVVRFLVRHDVARAARAKALIDSQPVLLLKTATFDRALRRRAQALDGATPVIAP